MGFNVDAARIAGGGPPHVKAKGPRLQKLLRLTAYYEEPPSLVGAGVRVHFDRNVVRILDPQTKQPAVEHL